MGKAEHVYGSWSYNFISLQWTRACGSCLQVHLVALDLRMQLMSLLCYCWRAVLFYRRAFFVFRSFSGLLCLKAYMFLFPEHPFFLKKTYGRPSNLDFKIARVDPGVGSLWKLIGNQVGNVMFLFDKMTFSASSLRNPLSYV